MEFPVIWKRCISSAITFPDRSCWCAARTVENPKGNVLVLRRRTCTNRVEFRLIPRNPRVRSKPAGIRRYNHEKTSTNLGNPDNGAHDPSRVGNRISFCAGAIHPIRGAGQGKNPPILGVRLSILGSTGQRSRIRRLRLYQLLTRGIRPRRDDSRRIIYLPR